MFFPEPGARNNRTHCKQDPEYFVRCLEVWRSDTLVCSGHINNEANVVVRGQCFQEKRNPQKMETIISGGQLFSVK